MYRLTILSRFLAVVCSLMALETAASTHELFWAQNNAPPFFITEGPEKGQGFGDPLQRMLEQELPDYQHITHQMPLRRLNQFWKRGANYCFATMIHQPLAADADYTLSIPNVFYRPHGVIAARDNAAVNRLKEQAATAYPLEAFLREPQMRFGLMSNRTFGPRIDALLRDHKHQIDVYDRSDADGLEGLFDMLKLGRVDYLIDYPFVFRYYDRLQAYHNLFQFIPLTDNRHEGVWGAVGCSNNPWGKQRIAAINSAIGRLMQRPDYRDLVVKWHAAEGDEKNYWSRLKRQVKTAQQTLPLTDKTTP